MELSLRKARKLEAKIQLAADTLSMAQAVKVRVQASSEERQNSLAEARDKFTVAVALRKELIQARFTIRNQIAKANAETGINDLITGRELIQTLLSNSSASVDSVDLKEAEDMAEARKRALENGKSGYGTEVVTITLPVSTKEDVESFKKEDMYLKKNLEDLEDQLSQKNLGVKIELDSDIVNLLQSVNLL